MPVPAKGHMGVLRRFKITMSEQARTANGWTGKVQRNSLLDISADNLMDFGKLNACLRQSSLCKFPFQGLSDLGNHRRVCDTSPQVATHLEPWLARSANQSFRCSPTPRL